MAVVIMEHQEKKRDEQEINRMLDELESLAENEE
jgi:hypothetical protein